MKEESIFIIAFVSVAVLSVILVGLCRKVGEYKEHARFLKMEIRRSGNPAERELWKRRLRCLRLTLIPFVSKKLARKIDRVFHPKKKKTE